MSVCGKAGHVALKCYHIYNHSYQAEDGRVAASASTGSYSIDSTLYIDSGATDHITSELDRMTVLEKYNGRDNIYNMLAYSEGNIYNTK